MKNVLFSFFVLLGIINATNATSAIDHAPNVTSFEKVLSSNNVWYTVTSSFFTGAVNYGRHAITEDSVLIGNHYYRKILPVAQLKKYK